MYNSSQLKKELEDLQNKPAPVEVKEANNVEAPVKEEPPTTPVTPVPAVQIKEEPVAVKEPEEEVEVRFNFRHFHASKNQFSNLCKLEESGKLINIFTF